MRGSSLTITAVILFGCLLWMDACLYFQIQSMSDADLTATLNASTTTLAGGDAANNSAVRLMKKFSFAFSGMSVKLMMTDPADNYLFGPLAEAFSEMVNFKENFLMISPNLVSYAGVASALVAAKLVTYDSSTMHKLSFVAFQMRTWLDDLDGEVARARMGIHKHVSLQKTSGYVVDGLCDAIGFVAYIIGCYIFMKNTIRRMRRARPANRYNLQSITEIKSSSPSAYMPLQQYNQAQAEEEAATAVALQHPDSDRNSTAEDDDDDDDDDDGDEDEEVHFSSIGDYHQRLSYPSSGGAKLGGVPRKSSSTFLIDEAKDYFVSKKNQFLRSKVYLEKIQNGKQSSIIFYRYIKEKLKSNLSNRRLVLVTVCFLLQIAMCASFWNRYILVYRELLESPPTASDPRARLQQAQMKGKILKSNTMYIIIWFWRLTNGHMWMQMLLGAVFIGRLWQFLDFIKYVGFVEIVLLAIVTELHTIDVRNFLTIT